MDWLREAVAEYLSGFSNETGSPHAARSGFLTQLCRGRRRVGIDDSAACGRTGRVMLGKFDAADGLVVPDVDTARLNAPRAKTGAPGYPESCDFGLLGASLD